MLFELTARPRVSPDYGGFSRISGCVWVFYTTCTVGILGFLTASRLPLIWSFTARINYGVNQPASTSHHFKLRVVAGIMANAHV